MLYRYSAFAFKVHIVEKLVFHFTGRYGLRHFENTVGKRGFAVVDMRDYAKFLIFEVSFDILCSSVREKMRYIISFYIIQYFY